MPVFSKRNAKGQFYAICRDVMADETPSYVEEADGTRFMTIDFVDRRRQGPLVDVTAEFFKRNFSRCSSLVKSGLSFRVTTRRSNTPVFARRHTSYVDPLDPVIEAWRERVVEMALADREPGEMVQEIRDLSGQYRIDREVLDERLAGLARGIARLAIGHLPFEEGRAQLNGHRDD